MPGNLHFGPPDRFSIEDFDNLAVSVQHLKNAADGPRLVAEKQGYIPDATFGAGDVKRGRPFPHMVLRNMLELDISPVQSVVKVDDTLTGIEEGLNAGAWGIGLAISGNEVGVQLDEWNAFSEEVKQKHRDRIYPTMYQRGAHYVVDSIADLKPCLDDIEARMKRGDNP